MIWVVTLNGFVWAVSESAEGADSLMQQIRESPQFKREVWTPVGEDGWSSHTVKSLRRRAFVPETIA